MNGHSRSGIKKEGFNTIPNGGDYTIFCLKYHFTFDICLRTYAQTYNKKIVS